MREFDIKTKIRFIVESKLRRFQSWWLYGSPRFPEGIAIETATYCNRTCDHCAMSSWRSLETQKQFTMPDKVFDKLIDRIVEMGWTGTISFNFFDEPLLNPRLPERVAAVRRRLSRNRLVCFTNGDFLTVRKMDEMVQVGLSEMWVSDHNNPITRPDEVKDDWHDRICEVERMFPQHVMLRGMVDYKPFLVNMGGYARPANAPRRRRCESVYGWFMVLYNGDVNLCSCEPTRRYIQGNIMERPLLQIWKESKILAVREGAGQGHQPMLRECVICLGGNMSYFDQVEHGPTKLDADATRKWVDEKGKK